MRGSQRSPPSRPACRLLEERIIIRLLKGGDHLCAAERGRRPGRSLLRGLAAENVCLACSAFVCILALLDRQRAAPWCRLLSLVTTTRTAVSPSVGGGGGGFSLPGSSSGKRACVCVCRVLGGIIWSYMPTLYSRCKSGGVSRQPPGLRSKARIHTRRIGGGEAVVLASAQVPRGHERFVTNPSVSSMQSSRCCENESWGALMMRGRRLCAVEG